MSWLTFWQTTEKDVQDIAVAFKRGFAIAEDDVNKIANWVDNNIGSVTSVITSVLSVVQILGVTNPAVEAGVVAANSAVQALNKFVEDHKSGQSTASSAIDAYSTFKAAQAASATAVSAALGNSK